MRRNAISLIVVAASFAVAACASSNPSSPARHGDGGADAEPGMGTDCTSPNAVPRKENGDCAGVGEYGLDPAQAACCVPCGVDEISVPQGVPTCVARDAGSTGSGGQVQAYCDAVASHGMCPGASAQPCSAERKCTHGQIMSPIAAAAYNACFASPTCKRDSECTDAAAEASGGAAVGAYVTDCTNKVAACPAASNDYCSRSAFAYTGIGEALAACLAKPCEELNACFVAGVKPLADCKTK